MTYKMPNIQGDDDVVARIATFVFINEGSLWSSWVGKMPKADQMKLFGRYFGRGTLVVDGIKETVEMYVKVCFGTDFDVRGSVKWNELL